MQIHVNATQAAWKSIASDIKGKLHRVTLASDELAKKGGLHMQKSYTIDSSFSASISKVFWGTFTTATHKHSCLNPTQNQAKVVSE